MNLPKNLPTKNLSFILILLLSLCWSHRTKAQSDNCATATSISIPASGTACVNGTTVGGTVDNITTSCNGTAVNFVWYQFTSTGTQNSITLTPGTLQNAVMVVDASGCGDALIDFCNTATGSNPITILNSQPVGTTILVSIASTSNTQGTFSLCVNSYTPANPALGDNCSAPIPYCNGSTNLSVSTMTAYTGSPKPSCFIGPGSAPVQDMFVSFTVYSAGTIAWTGNPSSSSTEFDWALFDITSGCPGSQVSCNYNFASQTGSNFGMGTAGGEFNSSVTGTVGHTYVIQISNWSGDGTGVVFSWQGTAAIAPTTAFTISPSFVCGTSATVNITNTSTGTPSWTFGNGNTYTGTTPPSQTYTASGTYAITATNAGACPSTATQYFSLYTPLAASATSTSVTCSGMCNGTASVSAVSGGNGVYTYSWTPGGNTTSSITGLCAGTYTVKVSNAFCGTNVTNTVTVVSPPAMTVSVNSPTICKNNSTTLTASGATTYSWSPSTGLSATTGASVTANPTVTTTYTVVGTTGTCTSSATSIVTVNPNPTVTVNSPSVCAGNSTTLNAGGATTYSWSPGTNLSGTTGASVTANPSSTTVYTIVGTTGTCTSSITSTVTIVPNPTVTVNSPSVCSGNSTTLNAGGATTYSWSPGTNLSATTGASVTANPPSTTTYTVVGTTGTCTSSATATVTVNPTPTLTVNSPTICRNNSATLTATGATTYSWSPATGLSATTGASVTANPTVTTTYTIVGTTGTCTSSITSIVTVNPNPTVTVNSPSICSGNSTTLNAAGATTYSWSPGTNLSATTGSSVTANPSSTTVYTIVGTTGTCTSSVTSTVTVNPTPTVTVNNPTYCTGGSAVLTAAGATTYSWSPSTGLSSTIGATVTASPASTTTYTIVGTTGTCTASATSVVTVVTTPTVTVNSPTICNGNSTTLTAAGATTYSWSPGTGLSATSGTSVTANPTVTTTYTITGTAGTCSSTGTSTVTVSPNPTVTVNSPTLCIGSSASLTAAGATTYSWSPATGLSATTGASVTANPTVTTTYTVVGTTATCTDVATSLVTVNPLPTLTVNSVTMCPGSTATLTATGASTYTWSPSGTLSSSTGASVDATPTVTTTYTITGTSAAGCTATVNSTVTIGGSITPTVNNATICAGSSATLTATGGTTYTWTPSASLSSSTGASVTANPTVTTTYTITAASGGCTGSVTAVVTVNPLPTVTVNSPSVCIGGSVTLNAAGATTYSWSPATGLSGTTGASVTANPTVTTTYTVEGTSTTCTAQATSTVTINPLPTITVNSATVCPSETATLTATGASTYTWSTGVIGASITDAPASNTSYTVTGTSAPGCVNTQTASISILPSLNVSVNSATLCIGSSTTLNATGASTYTWTPATGLSSNTGASVTANPTVTTSYTISGSSGTCSASATATVTVNPLPTITVNSGTICAGQQTATLTAGGASSYSWNPSTGLSSSSGASVTANPASTTSYTVTGTDANGCSSTNTTAVTVNPLPTITVNSATICPTFSATLTAAGASTYTWNTGALTASITDAPASTTSYTVGGTDANGCISGNTATITVNATLLVSASNNSAICDGATLNLSATTGVSWNWSGPGGFTSTSQNPTIPNASPAESGTYSVTATDANGCQGSAVTTVTVNPLPTITVNSGTICVGQTTATLNAGGASTYSWNPSTGLSSSTGSSVTADPLVTTDYTVTGTDVNGCVNTNTTTVTVNPLPTVTVNSATVCPTFSATLTAAGASTYTWNTGALTSSITDAPASTTSYTVAGTDANGCISGNTATITVNATLLVSASNNSAICEGSTLNLSASTGVSWSWNGPGGFTSSSPSPSIPNATPAASGTYSVTATDGNGCQGSAVTTVTVNPLPVVTVNSGTICVGQTTAVLNAGGASTYSWNPSTGLSASTGPSVTADPLTTTVYTVTGTDVNGCVSTNTSAVTVNPLPTVTVNSSTICPTFSATLTAVGAATYSWNTGATTASIIDSPASTTSYTVIGTDVNGCIAGTTATITVNPALIVAANSNSPICEGSTLNLTASTGASWSWTGPGAYASNSQNPSIVTATPAMSGTYSVTATDANGCQGSAVTTVTVNPLPVISAGSNSPVCVNQTLILSSSGGPGYSWNGPAGFTSTQQNPSITGVTSTAGGTYSLTVTDPLSSCASATTIAVVINSLPVVNATGATVCEGFTINLTSNGGNIYSWSGPGSYISNLQNPSIPGATPAMSGNYIVTASDANGCVNAAIAVVTVNSAPTVSVTSATTCAGQPASLTASGANSYNWSPGTGLNSTTAANVTAFPSITTAYSVIGTDLNGCKDTAIGIVTVIPLPIVSATPSLSVGCSPVCVSFTNTSVSSGTCSWNFGSGTISSYCSPTQCYDRPGTYSAFFTLTDSSGCSNSDTAKIIVYPVPVADFSFDPQPTTIFDPVINFHDQTVGGAVVTSHTWTFGDATGNTASGLNPVHTYLEPGTYPVQLVVTSNLGCIDSITKYVVITDEFMIYVPNAFSPNSDGINETFFAKGEGIKDFRMFIFDRWGNQVFFSDDILKGWDGRFQAKGTEIVQEDVYVWKIELKTFRNEAKTLKGTVSLIK